MLFPMELWEMWYIDKSRNVTDYIHKYVAERNIKFPIMKDPLHVSCMS